MTFNYELNRISMNDDTGKLVAEIKFPMLLSDVVEVSQPFIDESVRDQGIGDQLMTALANKLSIDGKKAFCTSVCARDWFTKHPEYDHIYIMRPEPF
jgi:Predicted acetyltransferase